MEKKWLMGVLLIIVVIGLVLLGFYADKLKNPYSDEPNDWIIDKGNGIKEIDVEEVTDGEGFLDENGQQYEKYGNRFLFDYDGLYNGVFFLDEIYLNEDDGKPIMRITPNLKPYDGVIEGFIVEKIVDNETLISNIFVDEDWKKSLGYKTNIIWGKDWKNFKKFKFTQIEPGIYMDSIEDERDRLSHNFKEAYGGIVVGDVTVDDVAERRIENLTLIRLS